MNFFKILWTFYFKISFRNLKRKSLKNLPYFLILFLIALLLYHQYFLGLQNIPNPNINYSKLVFALYIVFIINVSFLSLLTKTFKKKEILFFSQKPVKSSRYLTFIVLKGIFNKIWIIIIFFLFISPFIWRNNNQPSFIFLNFILSLLIYIHYYFSVSLLKLSKLIKDRKNIYYGILLCLVPLLFWLNFELNHKILYLTTIGFISSCLSLYFLCRFIRLNEKHIMNKIENLFVQKGKKSYIIRKVIKITGNNKSPILTEFIKNEIYTLHTLFISLIFIAFAIVYIIFLFNSSQIAEQLTESVIRKIFVGFFFLSQLTISGIMESRISSKNLFYDKIMPVPFYKFFLMDIVSFLKSFGIINLFPIIFTFIIDFKLGILITFDVFVIPSLVWLINFIFRNNKILGSIIGGIILIFYISSKIILSFYFIPIALGILILFYFIAVKNYKYLEII